MAEQEDAIADHELIEDRLKPLFRSGPVREFLQRNRLIDHKGVPIRKESINRRLERMDEQNSRDLLVQSIVEKGFGIERPLQMSDNNVKQEVCQNPCAVTMIYRGPRLSQSEIRHEFKVQSDETLVMQYHTSARSTMVYKAFLKPDNKFTFKSQRFPDAPFTIAVYLNGIIDCRISTCCEQSFVKQCGDLERKRSLFRLRSVTGGTPCDTCVADELLQSSTFTHEETESKASTSITSDHSTEKKRSTLSVHSEQDFSVAKHSSLPSKFSSSKLSSEPQKTAKVQKTKPSSIPPNTVPDAGQVTVAQLPLTVVQQLENPEPAKVKAEEIKTIEISEKMAETKESDAVMNIESTEENKILDQNDGKEEDKSKSAVTQSQNKEKTSAKISNEDEEVVKSVANHEMQQLLTAYLSLLVPASQSSGNGPSVTTSATTNINSTQSTNTIQQLRDGTQTVGFLSQTNESAQVLERKNVENCVVVWLDAAIDKTQDTINSHAKLRTIINSLMTFHKIDDALDFIKSVPDEKVFLIVSGSFGWPLIDLNIVGTLQQLDSIYIFCQDELAHKALIDREHKVRGIFTSIDPLCSRLKKDTRQTLNDMIPMSVASDTDDTDKPNSEKKKKQVNFLCGQLQRELLFTMEYPHDARTDLVEYCKNEYEGNATEQKFIEEFRNDYHIGKAVWW